MKRDKHSLSHYRLSTFPMGKLIPVGCFEVLPGDTVQQATSLLLRVAPLISPVMHPVQVRVHHWFVPTRILWDGWEKFITGGKDGMGDGVGSPPTLMLQGTSQKGGLLDHFGIPVGASGIEISTLPIEALKKIYFEFYVDQDLAQPPENWPVSGAETWGCPTIGWEKDYFTTSRPWTQKGPDVMVPLGDVAPVIPGTDIDGGNAGPSFRWDNPAGGEVEGSGFRLQINADSNANWSPPGAGANPSTSQIARWGQSPGLQVDLSQATGANVNDLRRAFALQRYQEARARYGSRYTEYLAYLGIRSSDARLQRPEYLGGGKATVSFSEVLQTAPGSTSGAPVGADTGVGTMAGHGITAMRSARYRRFFEEHGFVLSLVSVRPRTMYVQGIHRQWFRKSKEDYWQRELQQIGQQEVYTKELFGLTGAQANTVFGYQDRYSEYKQHPSGIAGDFRDTLNFWHFGRIFTQEPVLNASFVGCVPTTRVFQSSDTDPLWCMSYHNIQARRMVSRSGSARII